MTNDGAGGIGAANLQRLENRETSPKTRVGRVGERKGITPRHIPTHATRDFVDEINVQ